MLALFALGVMSLFWMAVVGGVILIEEVSARKGILSRLLAVSLCRAAES